MASLRPTHAPICLHYDSLAADPEAGRARIVAALNLPCAPDALVSRFAPNTSHDRGTKTRTIGPLDRATLAAGDALGRRLPLSALGKIEARRRAARGIDWPDWVWAETGFDPTSLEARAHPEHYDGDRDDR